MPSTEESQRHRWSRRTMIVALLLFALSPFFTASQPAEQISYSRFLQLLDSGRVATVEVGDAAIHGTLKPPVAAERRAFVVTRMDPALVTELRSRGVVFSASPSHRWIDLLSWTPVLLLLALAERSITAHHEMGHAVVALATPGADPVQKVSIIPHGMSALGYTLQPPAEDKYIVTQAELAGKLAVLLGGRAAELLVFKELSTGAADDLARATALARDMVMRFGMDETIGNAVLVPGSDGMGEPFGVRRHSDATVREAEIAVRGLLQGALDRAAAVLTLNRDALERGAAMLLEKETLARDEMPVVLPLHDEAEAIAPCDSRAR